MEVYSTNVKSGRELKIQLWMANDTRPCPINPPLAAHRQYGIIFHGKF